METLRKETLWIVADRIEDIRTEFEIRIRDNSETTIKAMEFLGYKTKKDIDEMLNFHKSFAYVQVLSRVRERVKDGNQKRNILYSLFGKSIENLISDFEI